MLLFSPRTILAIWGLPLPASASQSETLTEGDLESFLNQHGNHVYTYLCVMCRDEDAASEALQNAYMKFIEQVRRSRVRRDTAAQYLLTIAKNDHFSRVRKEGADLETICEKTGRSQATVYRLMEKALTILADACRRAGLHPEDAGL
ncbi:MAG TPA: sigma factor [Leptospiraceae bacterium]|nr:sigma factor [Leptospiraceae bacterium]